MATTAHGPGTVHAPPQPSKAQMSQANATELFKYNHWNGKILTRCHHRKMDNKSHSVSTLGRHDRLRPPSLECFLASSRESARCYTQLHRRCGDCALSPTTAVNSWCCCSFRTLGGPYLSWMSKIRQVRKETGSTRLDQTQGSECTSIEDMVVPGECWRGCGEARAGTVCDERERGKKIRMKETAT